MVFFRWFLRKPRTAHPNFAPTEQMALAENETPVPEGNIKSGALEDANCAGRDQLYEVIREVMTRSGVLSASYKFKVLSLDKQASSYLVMIDLSGVATGSAFRPADTEAQIVRRAMKRYAMVVNAVYWRLHAASLVSKLPDASAGHTDELTGLAQLEKIIVLQPAMLSTAMSANKASGIKSGNRVRSSGPLHDFEETEVASSVSYPALSATQYGQLH